VGDRLKGSQNNNKKHISLHFFLQFTSVAAFFAAEHEKKLFFTTKASGNFCGKYNEWLWILKCIKTVEIVVALFSDSLLLLMHPSELHSLAHQMHKQQ
jgi:hypothetical protein